MVEAVGKDFSGDMERCIDQCTATHQAALTVSGHALRHGGEENASRVIRVLSDCVELCQTAANFMLRGSPNHTRVCALNAEICREVARECGKFDDEPMRRMVEIATECAETCEAMAG